MSDWRNVDYKPVKQPEPSEWENAKFGIGVPLLGLATVGAIGLIVWGLATLLF